MTDNELRVPEDAKIIHTVLYRHVNPQLTSGVFGLIVGLIATDVDRSTQYSSIL